MDKKPINSPWGTALCYKGFLLRECPDGDWFVYKNNKMLFNTYLHGFETKNQTIEAIDDLLEVVNNG